MAEAARKQPQKTCQSCGELVHIRCKTCPHCNSRLRSTNNSSVVSCPLQPLARANLRTTRPGVSNKRHRPTEAANPSVQAGPSRQSQAEEEASDVFQADYGPDHGFDEEISTQTAQPALLARTSRTFASGRVEDDLQLYCAQLQRDGTRWVAVAFTDLGADCYAVATFAGGSLQGMLEMHFLYALCLLFSYY